MAFFEENENDVNKKAFDLAVSLVNEKREEFQLTPIYDDLIAQDPFNAIQKTCSVMKNGVLGIFGPKSKCNINAVQSVCDEKELPHILTRWMYYPLRPGK